MQHRNLFIKRIFIISGVFLSLLPNVLALQGPGGIIQNLIKGISGIFEYAASSAGTGFLRFIIAIVLFAIFHGALSISKVEAFRERNGNIIAMGLALLVALVMPKSWMIALRQTLPNIFYALILIGVTLYILKYLYIDSKKDGFWLSGWFLHLTRILALGFILVILNIIENLFNSAFKGSTLGIAKTWFFSIFESASYVLIIIEIYILASEFFIWLFGKRSEFISRESDVRKELTKSLGKAEEMKEEKKLFKKTKKALEKAEELETHTIEDFRDASNHISMLIELLKNYNSGDIELANKISRLWPELVIVSNKLNEDLTKVQNFQNNVLNNISIKKIQQNLNKTLQQHANNLVNELKHYNLQEDVIKSKVNAFKKAARNNIINPHINRINSLLQRAIQQTSTIFNEVQRLANQSSQNLKAANQTFAQNPSTAVHLLIQAKNEIDQITSLIGNIDHQINNFETQLYSLINQDPFSTEQGKYELRLITSKII